MLRIIIVLLLLAAAPAWGQPCGDNTTNGSEVCDGTDLNSYTCATLDAGLANGTLACNLDCGVSCPVGADAVCGYDTRACLDNESTHPPNLPYDPEYTWYSFAAENPGDGFVFAVFGECKDSCASAHAADVLDEFVSTGREVGVVDWIVNLGDLLTYSTPDWDDLITYTGDIRRAYPFFSACSDQDCLSPVDADFVSMVDQYCEDHYGCDDVIWWDHGDLRLFLSGYDGATGHETASDIAVNLRTLDTATLADVLQDMDDKGKIGIWFGHHQWKVDKDYDGVKASCTIDQTTFWECTSSNLLDEFEAHGVVLVFQADNPGYSYVSDGGVVYLNASSLNDSGSWDENCRDSNGYQDGEYPASCSPSCSLPCDAFYVKAVVDRTEITVQATEGPSGYVFHEFTVGTTPPSIPVVPNAVGVSGQMQIGGGS